MAFRSWWILISWSPYILQTLLLGKDIKILLGMLLFFFIMPEGPENTPIQFLTITVIFHDNIIHPSKNGCWCHTSPPYWFCHWEYCCCHCVHCCQFCCCIIAHCPGLKELLFMTGCIATPAGFHCARARFCADQDDIVMKIIICWRANPYENRFYTKRVFIITG